MEDVIWSLNLDKYVLYIKKIKKKNHDHYMGYSTDIRGNDKDELRNKRACNRGGKPVWWGLFRVWFGLQLNFNK